MDIKSLNLSVASTYSAARWRRTRPHRCRLVTYGVHNIEDDEEVGEELGAFVVVELVVAVIELTHFEDLVSGVRSKSQSFRLVESQSHISLLFQISE